MLYKEIMIRLYKDYFYLQNSGYEVVGVFLQGSQNYELDNEFSDIDTKAIVLPSFEKFLLNKKPISTTHILESNEHLDIKDIRLMFESFRKQNVNFVEILFTKYMVLNPKYSDIFNELLKEKELVARYNMYTAINCMCGMAYEKQKALKHPYPSLIEKIERYGYDPKQLHHIVRLREFLERYIRGESYAECLVSKNKDYLMSIKRGELSLEEAERIASDLTSEMHTMKVNYNSANEVFVDKRAEEILNRVMIGCVKKYFISEFK